MNKYYTLWSSGVPVGVVNRESKRTHWFDSLDNESRRQALKFERYDINRGHFISVR